MDSNKLQLKQKLRPNVTPRLFADCNLFFLPLSDLADACNTLLGDDPFVRFAPPAWQVRHIEDLPENLIENVASTYESEESLRRQLALIAAVEPAVSELSCDFWLSILDARGYLTGEPRELAKTAGLQPARFEAALHAIRQNIEPAGLFAADLRESFLLQLKSIGQEGSLAWLIISEGHEHLASGRIDLFLRERGISREAYEAAMAKLRLLDPAPGRRLQQARYAIPEVEFYWRDGYGLRARLMRENFPRIESAISEYRNVPEASGRHFLITPQVRDALIRLGMRYKTLYRLSSFLAERQCDFLLKKTNAPAPLVLKDAASACGVSVSTVQRIASQTWGSVMGSTVHLKSLFSRPASSSGMSLASVKKEIARLNALAYNDREIADILGMPERTVRWHRKRLGLFPVRTHSGTQQRAKK